MFNLTSREWIYWDRGEGTMCRVMVSWFKAWFTASLSKENASLFLHNFPQINFDSHHLKLCPWEWSIFKIKYILNRVSPTMNMKLFIIAIDLYNIKKGVLICLIENLWSWTRINYISPCVQVINSNIFRVDRQDIWFVISSGLMKGCHLN